MTEINLTQSEANALISMEKIRVDDQSYDYPGLGGRITVPITSRNKREYFVLDVSRGRIDLLKGSYHNRAKQIVILVRLDFGGQPHRNPDGQEVPSPHLHVYHEGYGGQMGDTYSYTRFCEYRRLVASINGFHEVL